MRTYDDIINYPHYELKKHPRMRLELRAAQFAPFAALTGYSEDVIEAGRTTMNPILMTEDGKDLLDWKMQMIEDKIKTQPLVIISYFSPDKKKEGGFYQEVVGNLKKIDFVERTILLTNSIKIKMDAIIDIQADCISAIPFS